MANSNETRALDLLAKGIHRPIKTWPGKLAILREMCQLPDLPDISSKNDAKWVWREAWEEFGGIRPDGYFIEPQSSKPFNGWNHRCHHLCLIEVEHTSPMTEDKVQRLGIVWDVFWTSDAWELHLILTDLYDQWREMDLLKFYKRNFQVDVGA